MPFKVQISNEFSIMNPDPTKTQSFHSKWCMLNQPILSHIWVSEMGNIGPGNGLPPVRRPGITCTNVDLLSSGHLGTTFNARFSFIKMHLKLLSAK